MQYRFERAQHSVFPRRVLPVGSVVPWRFTAPLFPRRHAQPHVEAWTRPIRVTSSYADTNHTDAGKRGVIVTGRNSSRFGGS